MNWYDRNRSTVSALALSFGLLTPIALGAIFFWAHKTQERLNSNIESQWVKHQTTAQLIRRDIEDLENQIQRTTGRVPVGEFHFFLLPRDSRQLILLSSISRLISQPMEPEPLKPS